MPIPTAPLIPLYQPAPVTREALDYADLAIIDLRNFATTAEERGKLALQVREAMSSQGFFYVIGHGYSSEQMKRMFDIADVPFSRVSHDEKEKYLASTKQAGSFQGYKLRQYWHIDNGVLDQVETYNIHRDVSSRAHPEALRPLLPEIDQFARHSHINVLGPILRLMALGLELPEETLLDMHRWDGDSETYLRYMKYFPRSAEDEQKTKNVWLKGHNDIGTITLLYSQPVSALQILARDGTWKWVKHIDNAILAPLAASPVLQRLGIKRRFEKDEDAPVMAEWRKARTAAYGQSILSKSSEETDIEQKVIQGVVVKHYS
ncbi:hypothetical protein HHX47_DHR2000528 [Lentinula edodes]|nr:hypothetical protein HHX47_DHR2000528 [Lentinula edodes]